MRPSSPYFSRYLTIALDESLAHRFSSPLLSVAGQRLVLNLKSFKTRAYTTNDLSHEVDRQLEAFVEVLIAPDGMGDPESEGEASGSGNPGQS
jgi:hypothetical protein